jgi:FkbH-like protein
MDTSQLRHEIEQAISRNETVGPQRLLGELWRAEATASNAAFVVHQYEKLRSGLDLVPHRMAILRSFTVEPIVPLLRAAAFHAGIDLTVQLSNFNAYVQEIIDPESHLYSFSPDSIFLAVQTRDIVPALWSQFFSLSPEDVRSTLDHTVAHLRQWIHTLRENGSANIVIHNFEQPPFASAGLLDARSELGQRAAIDEINRELRTLCNTHTNVHVLDYNALVARYGYENWHDERKWLTVRLPITSPHLNDLAREWLKFLHPLTGKVAKILALDLDNTLWGGIIGEDGMDGIRLGLEYPGAAFQDVQRALLELHARGILLAVCSKNNPDDAMEVIEKHPGMLLRPAHFAAMRINWKDKSQNLREIAAELNLGIDALAFLDDNPLEQQQVRTDLPEVHVIDPPKNPMDFARIVRECPWFERLALSREDQERGAMYHARRSRQELEKNAPSQEDFLRSLQQEVEIAPLSKATLPRIAQLINKTNQFNLTTRRYSDQQLLELTSSSDWKCFSIRVRDRFGDNGLVGAAITHCQGEVCEIDTFLLSCRIIGRTIETGFLWFLAEQARSSGARQLQGWFLPTKKNAPARDFYHCHGMQKKDENGHGSLWALDLSASHLACPDWIHVRVIQGEEK